MEVPVKAFFMFSIILLLVPTGYAGDIKWEGTYRFEGLRVNNPGLTDGGNNKAYILHHMILRPQFQAYDGLTIHSRFDLFNSGAPNDQLGSPFGQGLNGTPPAGTGVGDSNVIGDQQMAGGLAVNELYANWVHEFGVLTVGRAPMHFGLGMQFNAGYGLFDHWLENRDMISYKVVMGNFTIMPVLAKPYEGLLAQEDDVNDYILQVNYENPETELAVGFLYQARRSTSDPNSNDVPATAIGTNSTLVDNYEVDSYNVYLSQWVDAVKVAFELGIMDGNTGLAAQNGAEIVHDALGLAGELSYHPQGSHWGFNLDFGYASGDDPATESTFEGYIFDQNYDVAFLLFNHPMGTADFFRTAYLRNTPTGLPAAAESFDTEAISNTVYASFAVHYKWAQKFDLESRFTYAQLNVDPLNSNVDSDAGFEVDLSLKYEPFKGFQWVNRAGIFLPGAAFEGGTNSLPVNNAFGFETKAAISF
jgi:hypothetical protein